MSKRLFSVDRNNNKPQQPLLTRDKAEQMCQKKLREVRKVKSKLYQTVLVRNTLRYVQTSTRSIFSCQPDQEILHRPDSWWYWQYIVWYQFSACSHFWYHISGWTAREKIGKFLQERCWTLEKHVQCQCWWLSCSWQWHIRRSKWWGLYWWTTEEQK